MLTLYTILTSADGDEWSNFGTSMQVSEKYCYDKNLSAQVP